MDDSLCSYLKETKEEKRRKGMTRKELRPVYTLTLIELRS